MRFWLFALVACCVPLLALGQDPVVSDDPTAASASAGQGGGTNADFDSLIDLIVSTVATESWAENGGGEAEIRPFPGGVYVDAEGVLQTASVKEDVAASALSMRPKGGSTDVRKSSELRCVSLVRLEREMARRLEANEPLEEAMLALAGLKRVKFVFAKPANGGEAGDVVIAGPAGDWQADGAGCLLSTDGEAILRLDDLLTLLRQNHAAPGSTFGCSITPRQESLEEIQKYVARNGQQDLPPGGRAEWLAGLRESVGQQDIEVWGMPPTTRVAKVLVEADHHMKLIGMGLRDGVPGVGSYLSTVELDAAGNPPPMNVLRWWFTLNYEPVAANAERTLFELAGPGAKVLSENELLTQRGERVHTNASDEPTARFAHTFTAHFAELCRKYPVYGELRSIFDLTLAVAIMRRESLLQHAAWTPTLFLSEEALPLPKYVAPKTVETVVNHRMIPAKQNRRVKHIVAGVSGGVWAASDEVLSQTREREASVELKVPPTATQWWWDVK